MPSSSGKQHRFMAAVASNPKFAKKVGVPQSVGDEFLQADKGRKFKESEMKGMKTKKMAGGGIAPSKMGAVKTAAPSRDGVATKGKTKGTQIKMAGSTKGMKRGGAC